VGLPLVVHDFGLDILELQTCIFLHSGDDFVHIRLLQWRHSPVGLHEVLLVFGAVDRQS